MGDGVEESDIRICELGVFGGVDSYGEVISVISWIVRVKQTVRGFVIPGIGIVVSEYEGESSD